MNRKALTSFTFINDQIGSDEVGTGDFLAPIIVVAALVTKKTLPLLKQLAIRDSKKISNQRLFFLGQKIINEHLFPYVSLILNVNKYNQLIAKGYNLVQIKCLLHNAVLNKLHLRYPKINFFYLDQFVNEKKYYTYLQKEKKIIHPIMRTQGENHFPSVALASVLARYLLLKEYQKLNQKYHLSFPFGSSNIVDRFAIKFIHQYSLKIFQQIAKQHFKNYQRVIQALNL